MCQTLLSHAHNSPFSSLGRVEEGDDDHLGCQAWMVVGDDDDFHHGDHYHQMPVKQLKATLADQTFNISKGAGASEAPGQTKEEFSANDTSRDPKVLKIGPQHG